jgi:hypothetical protein
MARPLAERAKLARESFNKRFWYAEGGYLYDVVDGENGDDPSCRPNQVLHFCAIRYWIRHAGAGPGGCTRAASNTSRAEAIAPEIPTIRPNTSVISGPEMRLTTRALFGHGS